MIPVPDDARCSRLLPWYELFTSAQGRPADYGDFYVCDACKQMFISDGHTWVWNQDPQDVAACFAPGVHLVRLTKVTRPENSPVMEKQAH